LSRSDDHQGRFLPFENLRAVSLSNRGLINFGSGLTALIEALLTIGPGLESVYRECKKEGGGISENSQ